MPEDYSGVNATRTKAAKQVEAYLRFVNSIAELIHRLDPDHPVAVGNLDLVELDAHAKYAPAVDIFGANLYHGAEGFGLVWKSVRDSFDRPVLVTEYGCTTRGIRARKRRPGDAGALPSRQLQEEHRRRNRAGGRGVGNSIGGVVFEYIDEWWKSPSGSADLHDSANDIPMAFPDGYSSEEWLGIVSRGDGECDPFCRQPRMAYDLYRDKLWKRGIEVRRAFHCHPERSEGSFSS